MPSLDQVWLLYKTYINETCRHGEVCAVGNEFVSSSKLQMQVAIDAAHLKVWLWPSVT